MRVSGRDVRCVRTMSDFWIAIIAADPRVVPPRERWGRARDRFEQIVGPAEEIEVKVSDHVQFFDCGENLERIICPSCKAEIDDSWWKDRMDEDFDGAGFRLAEYDVPCCAASHTLNDLEYDWPQGFARFGIDAMNPGIGELGEAQRQELERILGLSLRAIHQHI